MKVTAVLSIIAALCLSIAACKSAPPAPPVEELAAAPVEPSPVEEEAPSLPAAEVPAPDPPEAQTAALPPPAAEAQMMTVDEPALDLAEMSLPLSPPPGRALSLVLPEPAPPVLAPPAPPPKAAPREPPAAPPAIASAPPSAVQAEPPAAPVTPPLAAQTLVRPAAPPRVRPAEPASAPPPDREAPLAPDIPARAPPVPVIEEKLEFSRSVHIPVGQTLEVPFRGTGWVFLGEVKSQQGMTYISRRSDPEGQSFILRAEAPGEYGLKFSKQDFVQDYILNDYVRVTVSGERFSPAIAAAGSSGESRAAIAEPRWPPLPGVTVSPPAQPSAKPIAAEAAPPPSAVPANPPVPPPPEAADIPAALPDGTMAEEYLRRVREEHAAGRIPQGIVLLEQFQQRFPAGSDEAWWLYGQLLEANSPRRDVRAALDYYRRLIQEYPQSPRRAEARRRAAYLERFYFNIQ